MAAGERQVLAHSAYVHLTVAASTKGGGFADIFSLHEKSRDRMNITLLSRLRRARWVHAVQLFVFATWVLNPFPGAFSYWTDSNGDGVKEEVANPAEGTSWWDEDSDGDNLTNAQEALFGSDPYSSDSDHDGLRDDAEQQLSDPTDPLDPWNWDSNGNGFSDFDEYYQRLWSYQPVVNYNTLTAGNFFSYSDADGDGVNNPEDSDPQNMDRDNDSTLNWNDIGYMDDPNNGYVPPPEYYDPGVWIGGNWYPSGTPDSDGDGQPDMYDAFPWGSYWYNGTEYGGAWSDRDGDGIPDEMDAYPDGSYWWNGQEYGGTMSDQDGDSLPDWADPWPSVAGSFWYNGSEYPGGWNDQDGDGIPDAADPTPDGSYWWNGTEYYGAWVDQDGDGTPDPFDFTPNGGQFLLVQRGGVFGRVDGQRLRWHSRLPRRHSQRRLLVQWHGVCGHVDGQRQRRHSRRARRHTKRRLLVRRGGIQRFLVRFGQ
jgi:hypothetical protein